MHPQVQVPGNGSFYEAPNPISSSSRSAPLPIHDASRRTKINPSKLQTACLSGAVRKGSGAELTISGPLVRTVTSATRREQRSISTTSTRLSHRGHNGRFRAECPCSRHPKPHRRRCLHPKVPWALLCLRCCCFCFKYGETGCSGSPSETCRRCVCE